MTYEHFSLTRPYLNISMSFWIEIFVIFYAICYDNLGIVLTVLGIMFIEVYLEWFPNKKNKEENK